MKKQMMFMLIGILVLALFFSGCGGASSEVEMEAIDEEAVITISEEGLESDGVLKAEELSMEDEQELEETAGQAMHGEESLEALIESDPVMAYLKMSMEEIKSSFGDPSMEGDWRGAYFLSYDQEELLFFFDYPELDKVMGVGFVNYQGSSHHSFLGLEPGITFSVIKDRLGDQMHEGIDETDEIGGYLYTYDTEQHIITIASVDDTPGVAGYIEILTKYEWR